MGRFPLTKTEKIKRFLASIEEVGEHWIWKAARCGRNNEYGVWEGYNKERHTAHKWAYILFVGPVPSGMQVDHECKVKLCVNPKHLRLLTPGLNNAALNKTTCIRNHELSGDNLYLTPDGRRECRTCHRLREAKRREKELTQW